MLLVFFQQCLQSRWARRCCDLTASVESDRIAAVWAMEKPFSSRSGLALTDDGKTLCVAGRASDYAALVSTADGLLEVRSFRLWTNTFRPQQREIKNRRTVRRRFGTPSGISIVDGTLSPTTTSLTSELRRSIFGLLGPYGG